MTAALVLAAALAAPVTDAQVAAGFERVMRAFYWEPTSLIYSCPPSEVEPASTYTDGFKVWERDGDYGHGLEDCAIVGGVALSGLCDAYAVTHDERLRETARKIARGLINLGTVHGVKGFIARGICVEDGRSVCALSSIDQHTHCLHGLWRYAKSPLFDEALGPDIRRVLSDVADRMTAQVTEANDWSFQQAVGHGTTRGICKMRFNWPHEGMRLAMFYAAAWSVAGSRRHFDLYRRYLDEGIAKSMELATATGPKLKQLLGRMPDYTLLQMQTSLELVLAVEPDPARRERVRACMDRPAEMAAGRAKLLGSRDTRWLCGCGELQLAQLMAPGRAYPDEQRRILEDAIRDVPFASRASCVRIVHLSAAWWRMRRNALGDGVATP